MCWTMFYTVNGFKFFIKISFNVTVNYAPDILLGKSYTTQADVFNVWSSDFISLFVEYPI